ncbi:sigma-70 family RNA polymerase sigma factor [Vagococcus xieshaowenii]|uniref:Sigma-70 family RNA polymerase sigma factor n=1 Tax=Vagococcus xieshaowenii TaxID=2562451 RepID=A0AAJ5EEV4_9ENTE|nr:sigma-70 family RNA polymerase sigma factor [Vagococcus xieshaowenii]TFZ41930.1 sigma-70 family RNA polymerase sigma factor [Vagococcus xieshaowenii]
MSINSKELSRWENYIDMDGDLAKHQTFLTAIQKQSKLKEVLRDLNERLKKLENEKAEIVELIDKFQGLEQCILKKKYVEGLTLESIADELGYSLSYIKSKHAELMRIIRFNKKSIVRTVPR